MPQFTSRPPKDAAGYGLPIVRTPANGRLILGITCTQMCGCPTHWYGGRTVPCEGENCTACNEGYSWRWHGYVSGLISGTRRHVLAEFTAQASEAIADYHKWQGTLRGAILTATRHKNRHNGRVIVNLTAGDLAKMNLPAEPDIVQTLGKLWNLPIPNLTPADRFPGVKRIRPQNEKDGNGEPPQVAGTILPHDLH